MPQKPPTRQIIIEAVIACIEKYGLEHVTTRRIAEEAGTNIASINYHFRSKDELIAETLSLTSKHMLEDVMHSLEDTKLSFESSLKEVFRYLLEGGLRYPGTSRAHLTQAVFSGRKDSAGGRAMAKIFEAMVERAARAYPRRYKEVLRMRLAQVMYAVMFQVLTPDFFGVVSGKRLTKAEQAQLHADSLASLFFRGM